MTPSLCPGAPWTRVHPPPAAREAWQGGKRISMSGRLNASMFAACRERNAANASMFADASSGKTTLFLYRRKAFLANFSPSAINFGAWRRGSSTPSSELRSELGANEIYEDLATGRPLPFLRVGQRQSVLRRHPASARCAQALTAVVGQ